MAKPSSKKKTQPDSPAVKAWVETQEAILKIEEHAKKLRKFMKENKTAAMNPARQASLNATSKKIISLSKDIEAIEKEISSSMLDQLKIELAEVKAMTARRKKQQRRG